MPSPSAPDIDDKLLPAVCVLDAGVLMLAWLEKKHRPATPVCRALWKSLVAPERLARGCRVLIPAPVLAELMRGERPSDPPRIRGVQVAPFTSRAARLMAQHLPHAFIEHEVAQTQLPRAYVKYDALIVATAIAYEATLVTLDGWPKRLTNLPIHVRHPDEFRTAQESFSFPSPAK